MRKNKIFLLAIIAMIFVSVSCSLLDSFHPLDVGEEILIDPSELSTTQISTMTLTPETQRYHLESTATPELQNANLEATSTPGLQTADLEATATPELQRADLEAVEIGGVYTYFWVLYEPDIWQVGENEFGYILVNKDDPTCKIKENVGMGINWTDVTFENFQEQISDYQVDLTQYISSKGEIFLEIFSFNSEMIFIAIDTGNEPDDCRIAARQVIEKSAENGFIPIQ